MLVSLYVAVHVVACVHADVCMYVRMYVEDRYHHGKASTLHFERGSLTILELDYYTSWLTNEPQGPTCLSLPITGILSMHHLAWLLYVGPGD